LRLLNDVVDLICERKDLTAVIYDICNYQESDSGCAFGKVSQALTSQILLGYSQYICSSPLTVQQLERCKSIQVS
jgi:hypothetical protein